MGGAVDKIYEIYFSNKRKYGRSISLRWYSHSCDDTFCSPMTVTRIFSKEKDGYNSVQVGSGTQKKKGLPKAGREP